MSERTDSLKRGKHRRQNKCTCTTCGLVFLSRKARMLHQSMVHRGKNQRKIQPLKHVSELYAEAV